MILEFVGYDTDQDNLIDEAVKMDYMPRVGEVVVFTGDEEASLASEDKMPVERRYIIRDIAHVIHSGKDIPSQSKNKTAIIYVEPK